MSKKFYRTVSFIFCAAVALSYVVPCFAEDAPAAQTFAPGPALEARQKLFERIQQAKAQGVGIGGYLTAFNALEDQVKAGDAEDKIRGRAESINKAVNEQIEKAKVLKLQKPAPPTASQMKGSDSGFSSQPPKSGGAPGGGAGGGDMASKIKEKFGDKLENLPDSIKDKIMNNPDAQQKIMEKLKGQ
jgi:hypothetical protein